MLLKSDFLVQGWHVAGEVDKFVNFWRGMPKLLKSFYFRLSCSTGIIGVAIFGQQFITAQPPARSVQSSRRCQLSRAGESCTPSPVTATMAPCLWQLSAMISFCCGDMRANTISEWLRRISSMSAGVMSRRSEPWTTHAFAFLHRQTTAKSK